MRYDLTGASETGWQNASFDSLGEAIQSAMAAFAQGWRSVRIETNDGLKLNERAIRDIHELVTKGVLNA